MISLPDLSISPALAPQSKGSSGPRAATSVTSAAQEFESILLGQWLQAAESSFGSAPGGPDDADTGGEQIQGFAVQRLAVQLAASGGVGIAQLLQDALTKSSGVQLAGRDSTPDQTVPTTSGRIREETSR